MEILVFGFYMSRKQYLSGCGGLYMVGQSNIFEVFNAVGILLVWYWGFLSRSVLYNNSSTVA